MSGPGTAESPAPVRRALIVLAHPDPRSLCAALARRAATALAARAFSVDFVDLYAEGFDPILRLEEARRRASFELATTRQAELLQAADALLFVHPDWWGLPPAILKGWLDRVLTAGVAYAWEEYESGERLRLGLLRGKRAAVVATGDEADAGLLVPFWRDAVFAYCGLEGALVQRIGPLRAMDSMARREAADEAVVRALAVLSG